MADLYSAHARACKTAIETLADLASGWCSRDAVDQSVVDRYTHLALGELERLDAEWRKRDICNEGG